MAGLVLQDSIIKFLLLSLYAFIPPTIVEHRIRGRRDSEAHFAPAVLDQLHDVAVVHARYIDAIDRDDSVVHAKSAAARRWRSVDDAT